MQGKKKLKKGFKSIKRSAEQLSAVQDDKMNFSVPSRFVSNQAGSVVSQKSDIFMFSLNQVCSHFVVPSVTHINTVVLCRMFGARAFTEPSPESVIVYITL